MFAHLQKRLLLTGVNKQIIVAGIILMLLAVLVQLLIPNISLSLLTFKRTALLDLLLNLTDILGLLFLVGWCLFIVGLRLFKSVFVGLISAIIIYILLGILYLSRFSQIGVFLPVVFRNHHIFTVLLRWPLNIIIARAWL